MTVTQNDTTWTLTPVLINTNHCNLRIPF